MNCERCYKYNRCFERRGVCAEFRDLEAIRREVEVVMQSAKVAGTENPEDRREQSDR